MDKALWDLSQYRMEQIENAEVVYKKVYEYLEQKIPMHDEKNRLRWKRQNDKLGLNGGYMRKAILALCVTVVAGLAGIYLGTAINLEGYLGIILSIAVMGFFIISAIEDKK